MTNSLIAIFCETIKLDELVKSQKGPVFVIPAPHQVRDKLRRESSKINQFWTPAFAGVKAMETFCETVKLDI